MGFAGSYLPAASVFLVAAALAVPALLSLSRIGRGRATRHPARSSPPDTQAHDDTPITWDGMKLLVLDKRLVIFAASVVLFFAASAAIGPGAAAIETTRHPELATLVVAATILIPQSIVAAISPWIGRTANISGRKPLLLLGWGLLPVQALLYAVLPFPYALVVCNLLNAVSAAVFGVLMTVVVADITHKTGCFNLTLGALGVAMSVGASLSTFFTFTIAGAFGATVAALGLAFVGLCGLLLLWAEMPETRTAAFE